MRLTQIENMLNDHEKRIKELESKDSYVGVDLAKGKEPTSAVVKSAMIKEAEASVALDGETQTVVTITPELDKPTEKIKKGDKDGKSKEELKNPIKVLDKAKKEKSEGIKTKMKEEERSYTGKKEEGGEK